MVDLLLLEKFLLTVIPNESKNVLLEVFQEIRMDRLQALGISLGRAKSVFESNELSQPFKFFYTNGMIAGILLASFACNSSDKEMFQGWLDQQARNQGENIVDIFSRKAGKDGQLS